MKRLTKIFCIMLAAVSLFSACGANDTPPGTTKPTNPTKPTQPPIDINRALPVLAEKYVTANPADGDLLLAENGEAKATVVYPAGNSKARSAAGDLANYLKKITGAAFSLIADDQALPEGNLILVGPTAKTVELGVGPYTGYPDAEKISVIRKENCLILCGNDDAVYQGTQNAVTCFLEEAGCGWFSDEALWQIVPNCPTLAVKAVNKTYSPAISGRTYGRIPNTLTTRWYMGGDKFEIGHGLWRWGGGSKYAAHPEWFAQVNGVRTNPATVPKGEYWQYCYTNEEFARHIANGVIDFFNKNPNLVCYSIASNDGWYEGWCECDTCTATGNQSDQYLLFANRVAEVVAEKYPEKRISFLAYHPTFLPPENDVKAHENVEVTFCLETNPLDDLMADRQIHFGYNSINKLEYTQSWLDNVTEWIEKADLQNVSIWGWFCIDEEMYGWHGAPWIQGNVASRNIDVFEQLGVTTVFVDGTYPYENMDMTLRWPLYYTFAKCLYFNDLTGEEVLYDACKKLYGEAADEMFLFYRILADSAQESTSPSGVNWVPPPLLDVYSKYYNEIIACFTAVRAKLPLLTDEQAERVNNQLRGWLFIDLYI